MEVGGRVRDENGCRGTVRYVGPVATSKEATWVGVEWDDPLRGKHDGAIIKDGVIRYFQTKEPKGGSFVKPAKLDAGTSFVAALRARYVEMAAPLEAPNECFEGAFANTKRGPTKPIQFKGELQVRERQQLDDGCVSECSLRFGGVRDLGEVRPSDGVMLARLEILDLQCNLLGSWAVVEAVVAALPNLTSLDVSGNKLGRPDGAFPQLRSLAANKVGLETWDDVETLLSPSLERLHVAGHSDLCRDLERNPETSGLQFLDVADTGLVDAGPLAAQFPNLDELHASENPNLTLSSSTFPHLTTLAVASCGVGAWSQLDDLTRSCPALRRLRFGHDNPVVRSLGPSEARAFLIARLPGILQLNGADISKKERRDSEKRFLRVSLAHNLLKKQNGDGLASQQQQQGLDLDLDTPLAAARLKQLMAAYDDVVQAHNRQLDPSKHLKFGANTLAASLLTIKLRSVAAASVDAPAATEQLPASTKISLVKRLAANLFDIPPQDQLLYFKPEPDAMPSFLDDDSASLAYFGVPDGATIDVGEKLL